MNLIFTFVIVVSIILVVIEVIHILIKIIESFQRLRQNLKIIESFCLKMQHKIYFENLCKREEVIYRSYILHNSIYFISNFFSLQYSIATFATTAINLNDDVKWKAILLSVLTITFIVINMYVKPQHHANQYLLAWRMYETHTQTILQHNYSELTFEEISEIIKDSITVQANIEKSLKYDELISN